MAFPGLDKTPLSQLWTNIKKTAGDLKNTCVRAIAAPVIQRSQVMGWPGMLADTLDRLDSYTTGATTNGLLAYARDQENNPTLDLVGAYTAMRAQIVALQDWIVTNFPKDASGAIAVYTFDGTKRLIDVPLTAPQLAAFKTQLNALVATID